MAVRAVLQMTVRAGRHEEFEAAWRTIAAQVRQMPGNVRQTLLRDRDDERRFLIMTDWVDADAFRQFEQSPEQDDLTAPLRALRESGEMDVFQILHHIEGNEGTDDR